MKGLQLEISGNWGHFKKPETNNNPLSHDLITKTAFIGLIGAVLGIERLRMKKMFPLLSDDILYGVRLLHPVKKLSCGFTSHTATNPTEGGRPKYFELLREPKYLVAVALKNNRSEEIFEKFKKSLIMSTAIYQPVLGWHNCPADLKFLSEGEFSNKKIGIFETKGFVLPDKHSLKSINEDFRIGFDKLPTYQNDDFWNIPDKYLNVIYPDCNNSLEVEGEYFEYLSQDVVEKWCLI